MFLRSLASNVTFSESTEGSGGSAPAVETPAAEQAPAPAVESAVTDALLNATPPAEPAKEGEPPKATEPAKEGEPPKTPEPVVLDPKDYKLENLPDGISADDELVASFLEGAAKGGMDNDSVNAVIGTLAPKLAERLNAPVAAFKQMNEKWQQDALADPVIGGSKDKLVASVSVVKTAMNGLGLPADMVTDALRTFEFTGAGNHPAVLRVMHAMASRLVEKTVVQGSGPAPQSGRSAAERMYPSSTNAG